MSARKARKLADGSRKETCEESGNFSVDEEFSLDESRTHRSIRPSLDNSQSTDDESSSQSPRKKRKLNGVTNGKSKQITQSSDSDNSEENSESEEDDYTQNGFSTQVSNDESSDEKSIMSEDENRSSEENERPLSNEELQADCGTVESLTLSNFMCHEHFEITFNPRVNFVIGKNGSKYPLL